MIGIANTQFWVHDQEEALAFYTRTLGWEVRSDVTMEEWRFRWLVVGPMGQDDVGLVLMPVPGPPMLDAESSGQLAELVAKGAGGTLFLETDDCQASYDELSGRGVVFNDPPTPQPTVSTRRFAIRQATASDSPRCSSSRWIAADGPRRNGRLARVSVMAGPGERPRRRHSGRRGPRSAPSWRARAASPTARR